MKNLYKNHKGITLIALIITIIVLLILAGVTIAAITSNESAPKKAVQARDENERGAARDAATLLVAEKIQAYYEGKYVGSDEIARGSSTIRDYLENENVLGATDGVVTGEYTVKVASGKITVKKGGNEIAKGSVDSSGVITWDATPSENGGGDPNPPVASKINIVGENLPAVGDVVAYNPGNLTTANIELPEGAKIEGTKLASIESELPAGASISNTIDARLATEWKVLKTVTDGNNNVTDVLIIPTTYDTNSLTLEGKNGYNNAISALNAVSQIYLNPTYAKSAKSITVEDVNELEGHEPDGSEDNTIFLHEYGMNEKLDIVSSSSSDVLTGSIETESNGETITISGNLYSSSLETGDYEYSMSSENILNNMSCWLASRCVDVYSNSCYFYVRYLNGGDVKYCILFGVDGDGDGSSNSFSYSSSVLPVVSLKSGITMTETNEGWALSQ